MEFLKCSEGEWYVTGEVVSGEVEVPEIREGGERFREGTGEEILGEVEVEEVFTEGDLEREGLVNGVVEEVDRGEVRETTENRRREWALDVGVGEVEFCYGGVCGVAADTVPVAGCGVSWVP